MDDMDTAETVTAAQLFEDVILDLVRLNIHGYTFGELAALLNQLSPGLDLTTYEVFMLFDSAIAAKALAYPDGRVEVEVFGSGAIKHFADPDYPEGTVKVWPNGRQWLLVRNTPPRELPRLPRERWPRAYLIRGTE